MAHESLGGPPPEPARLPRVAEGEIYVSGRRVGKTRLSEEWLLSRDPDKPLFDPDKIKGLSGASAILEIPAGSFSREALDIMTGGILSTPPPPPTPKVFIDGIEITGVQNIEARSLGAETAIHIERTIPRWRGPLPPMPATPTPQDMVEALGPVFDIGEAIKKELAERGWTYEAAEEVAVNYVNATIEKGINDA